MESDIYGVSFYSSFLLLTTVNFGQCATMQRIIGMFGQVIIYFQVFCYSFHYESLLAGPSVNTFLSSLASSGNLLNLLNGMDL